MTAKTTSGSGVDISWRLVTLTSFSAIRCNSAILRASFFYILVNYFRYCNSTSGRKADTALCHPPNGVQALQTHRLYIKLISFRVVLDGYSLAYTLCATIFDIRAFSRAGTRRELPPDTSYLQLMSFISIRSVLGGRAVGPMDSEA